MNENQPRDDSGEFGEKVTEQDILKVFDATDDPFLTTTELAEELPVSRQAVHHRLEQMREKGLVDKKKTGARGAGWWATIAPRLSPEARDRVESADRDNAIALDDLSDSSYYRLRVGDYRVIIDWRKDENELFVRDIGHRRNIYD